MNATHCYILVQITSYSFEVQGASLDESRADRWKQNRIPQSGKFVTYTFWKL